MNTTRTNAEMTRKDHARNTRTHEERKREIRMSGERGMFPQILSQICSVLGFDKKFSNLMLVHWLEDSSKFAFQFSQNLKPDIAGSFIVPFICMKSTYINFAVGLTSSKLTM